MPLFELYICKLSNLICIFMNINENIENKGKNHKQINKLISAQTIIVACLKSFAIQFDMFVHPIILYENDLFAY